MGLDPYYSSSVPKTTVREVSEGTTLEVIWASLKVLGEWILAYSARDSTPYTPTKSPWAAIGTKAARAPRGSLKTFGPYLSASPPTIHDQPTPA